MSRAFGQVAVAGEFEASFIVRSIYTRLVRESEQPNHALQPTDGQFPNRSGLTLVCPAWLSFSL
jgi:hypothetical protein